jgi:putative sterol carrier protein
MADATTEFFEELAQRGHEPLLQNVSGTLRVDVYDGRRVENWFVAINKGDVAVSHKKAVADAVLRVERALGDAIASGKTNPMAAFLRGAAEVRGDLGLVISFQRLYPGPPRPRTKARAGAPRSTR